jgi:hypothetical protein
MKGDWSTSHTGNFNKEGLASQRNMKVAGGAQSAISQTNDPRQMQYMQGSDRTTGVTYSGIEHSDNDLITMFRDKLAQRGARGILGLGRVFKVMDDNGTGTLDI